MWKSELMHEQLSRYSSEPMYRAIQRIPTINIPEIPEEDVRLILSDVRTIPKVEKEVKKLMTPIINSPMMIIDLIIDLMDDAMLDTLFDILSDVDKMNEIFGMFMGPFQTATPTKKADIEEMRAENCMYRGFNPDQLTPGQRSALDRHVDRIVEELSNHSDYQRGPKISTSMYVLIVFTTCMAFWYVIKRMSFDTKRAKSAAFFAIYAYVMHRIQETIPTETAMGLVVCNTIICYICMSVYHELF